jgi:hypothetical protein
MRNVDASTAKTSEIPPWASASDGTRRGATSAGSAMMAAASAGEMIPESDQTVCTIPLARGSRWSGTSMA